MRIDSNGTVEIPGGNSGIAQSSAKLDVRVNGSGIEFGHANNGDWYFGTVGSYGSAGNPFISFSCMNEQSANTWTTKGVPANIIQQASGGSLQFMKIAATNSTGQSPTLAMELYDGGRLHPVGGIFLGSSNNSNLLDHYEEGNWTPVIAHNDGTGVVPLNVAAARYVRVGDLVYVSAYLTAINPNGNAGGSGSYYGIRGFPFTPENYGAWQIVYASSGITAYGGYSGAASLYFMANGTNGQRSQVHVNGAGVNAWGSSLTLMMNCVYNING